MMFQESLEGVERAFQESFWVVSSKFFKGVSGYFKEVPWLFQVCFKDI